MPLKVRYLIDQPYGHAAYQDMIDAAKEEGWKRPCRSAYMQQAQMGDLKFFDVTPRPVRIIHFTNTDCYYFSLDSVVFCVILMSDGTIRVDKHLVGKCVYCDYVSHSVSENVANIRTLRSVVRAKTKRRHTYQS